MKNFLYRLACPVLLLVFVATATSAEPLVVMSYNLRYASDRPPNAWPDRLPIMKDCIREVMPDLIGTQEGVYHQLKELASDLPEYEWIGLGRDGGSRGEFMAVFYRRDRLEPLEYDHFWLSDTPDVVASTTWGNSNRRMVTWVRFKDLKGEREFYLINTHFDHQIQEAREKSARLIRERVIQLNQDLPIVFTGDFNASAGANPAYDILVGDGYFKDSWNVAAERKGEATLNTFNGFQETLRQSQRIDWILVRGPVNVLATQIIEYSRDGQSPSDHLPVVAWLEWRGTSTP